MPTARDVTLSLTVSAAVAALLVADHRETPYDELFEREGKRTNVPPDLLRSLARHESGFRSSAVSTLNANGTRDYGLMQVNEATARNMGREVSRLLEPAYNVAVAADLLAAMRRELGARFSDQTWIAAYNAGSPAILRRGIFNVAYVSSVWWHLTLYRLAGLLKGSA